MMGMARLGVIILLVLLTAALWFAYDGWTLLGAADLPAAIWLAMAGGIVFSLVIGAGLMALVFYSSRHGYDDRASGADEAKLD